MLRRLEASSHLSSPSLVLPALMLAASLATVAHAGEGDDPKKAPRKEGRAVIPEDASEGPRKIEGLGQTFGHFTRNQPYGRAWPKIVKVDPPPKSTADLGEAKTHPSLAKDEIEMQAQSQFLEQTEVEARYGLVSIRAVRVYRYGKLQGVQLVLSRIGRDEARRTAFEQDVHALGRQWKTIEKALGLGDRFEIVRNDLVDKAKQDPQFPRPPLRIEIEPRKGNKR